MAVRQPSQYDWRSDPGLAPGAAVDGEYVAPGGSYSHSAAAPIAQLESARGGIAMAQSNQQRSNAEFERAHRHSRRVRFLKLALPASGLVAILGVIMAFLWTTFTPASIDLGETRIENGRLVMRNPKLTGTDDAARPYNLTADKAFQQADTPTRISLEGISGRLPMSDTEFAKVRAGNGVYDTVEETLLLGGNIMVDTDTGLAIRMRDADIDIDSGKMRSDNEVSVDTGRAQITARSLTIEDNGRVIVFEDRVKMTLLPFSENEESGANDPADGATE